jgi:hypothetical protein
LGHAVKTYNGKVSLTINVGKDVHLEGMMGRIVEHIGSELSWVPMGNTMGWELHEKELVVGSVLAEGKFLSNATGKCVDGGWKFKRVGALQANISIMGMNDGMEIALFKKNAFNRNGSILVNKEKKFTINANFLMAEYNLARDKESILTLSDVTRFPILSSKLKIDPNAMNIPELPWLVLFSWYLAVMQHFDLAFNTASV